MKDKIKFIKELASNMNENKIDSVKYEDSNFEVEINKKGKEKRQIMIGGGNVVGVPSEQNQQPQTVTPEIISNSNEKVVETKEVSEEVSGTKIESPMVGTYYASPSPDSAPYIKEGDTVSEGQTLCIVEAMKLMNEVKSTVSGKVLKIMAKNGDAIKKGQVLVIIG